MNNLEIPSIVIPELNMSSETNIIYIDNIIPVRNPNNIPLDFINFDDIIPAVKPDNAKDIVDIID